MSFFGGSNTGAKVASQEEILALRDLLKLRTEERDAAIQQSIQRAHALDQIALQANAFRNALAAWANQCPCSCPACHSLFQHATGGN